MEVGHSDDGRNGNGSNGADMKETEWIDLQNKSDDFWDGFEAFGKMLLLRAMDRDKKIAKHIEGDMLVNWIKVLMKKRHSKNVKYTKGRVPRWG